MSYLFQKCTIPPAHIPLDILIDKFTPDWVPTRTPTCGVLGWSVKQQFQALVESVPRVPRDIWALILRELLVLNSVPDITQWDDNYIEWFQHWNYTPSLREMNPLIVYDNNEGYALHKLIVTHAHEPDTFQIGMLSEIRTTDWYEEYAFKESEINRNGDMFCGLVIDPESVQFIESIRYRIGGHILPMLFDLQNPIKQKITSTTNERVVDLYQAKYLPFVPLISLSWHPINIQIFFKDGTPQKIIKKACTQMQGIWTLISSPYRRHVVGTDDGGFIMHPPQTPIVESRWVPGEMIPDPDHPTSKYFLRINRGLAYPASFDSEEQKKHFYHPSITWGTV